jgi:hypothetical protein
MLSCQCSTTAYQTLGYRFYSACLTIEHTLLLWMHGTCRETGQGRVRQAVMVTAIRTCRRTRRMKAEGAQHAAVQHELDAANERFKEFERRDVQLREDLKHLKAKRRKLAERLQRDGAKRAVRWPRRCLPRCGSTCLRCLMHPSWQRRCTELIVTAGSMLAPVA